MRLAGLERWGGDYMAVLYAFICITLTAAVASTAFIFGRQVGYIKRDSEAKDKTMQEMQQQIEQMQLEYLQLETQYRQEQQDDQRRNVRPGGWDPDQLGTR